MALPENLLYARINFDVSYNGTPTETASIGWHGTRVHFTGNTVDWDQNLQYVANSIRDYWNDDLSALKSRTGSVCVARDVELYQLDTAGYVAHKGVSPFSGGDAWAGSAGATMPYQCAICVSHYAYTPGAFATNARSKRGRLYLPSPSAAILSNDGVITPANRDAILTAWSTFMNHIQGTEFPGVGPGPDADYFNVQILSRTMQQTFDITQLGIGLVVDTQRRRRKSIPEARTWTALNHA